MRYSTGFLISVICLWSAELALADVTPRTIEGNPVVVTTTRQVEEILRIPSHVTVMTQEDIQNSNASNLGELLKTQSGLWVDKVTSSTPSEIFIDARGFNNAGNASTRLLVLIDGQKMNQSTSGTPDWSVVPLDSIERVEIMRGSATALYGDNAMSGVINIITKKGVSEPSMILSADYRYYDCWDKGGINRVDLDCWNRNASLSGMKGSLSYYLFGGYVSEEGFRDDSSYQASNYIANFDYKTTPLTTIHLRGSYISNEGVSPDKLSADQIERVGRDGNDGTTFPNESNQAQYHVGYETYLGEYQWFELTGGQIFLNHVVQTIKPNSFFEGDTDSTSDSASVKYRHTNKFNNADSQFTIGFDYLREVVESDSIFEDPSFTFTSSVDYDRDTMGVYAQEEVTLKNRIIVTQAARIDWATFDFLDQVTGLSEDRSFRLITPTFGLTYLVSPNMSLFGTWSESFRFPNQNELTGFFGFTSQLDPEEAKTTEIGAQIRSGRSTEMAVSVYRMDVKDEIFFNPEGGDFGLGESQNLPEVRHQGVEFSGMLRLSEGSRIKGGYTFTDAKITEGTISSIEGNRLPNTPKHTGSMTLDLGHSPGWVFSFTGRYVGPRLLINDLSNTEEELNAYTVYDGRLKYFGEKLDFFVGVNNIFDREYEESGGVGIDLIAINPAPGRNGVAGVSLKF